MESTGEEERSQEDDRGSEPPAGGAGSDEGDHGPLGNPASDEEALSHGQQEQDPPADD
ncbi:MAG: hypothetical protein ACR2G3_06540 [Solirubrobacterales bacterium]